ncbi:UNVERIFIED_CONTAM: Villin-4 [Sesamum angustifolium]|uniref:Villin-4 n=1 Tax=Sesamum angustifolium TaxID=2727405 RepID=A0AAW2PW98_9LAMI
MVILIFPGQLPEEAVLEILEKYYVCFSKKFGTSIPRGRTEGCSGIEIWRIENFQPVAVPKDLHGKFFTGDSYVILKTTALKSGALRHDIHYWLGKDTSQDEAGTAAIKTVELDAVLGGRAVQYREVQGHETEKFLSYFKPCIIPQEGGIASGFKHAEAEEHQTRLYVTFARSSLNHDDVFILDTKSKIFQFNGSNSSIQERAKALEVVQYIKDTFHDGKCEIAAIEDGRLMSDAETGEFWVFFGGFAPLPKKTTTDEPNSADLISSKLFCVEKGEAVPVEADSLTRELLDTSKCYILDCGMEVFVWMGKELLHGPDRSTSHVIRVMEGYETVMFCSKFDSWPQSTSVTGSEEGRGRVAALLKRQGVNVKGLVKAESPKAEPEPHIDCTGDLQMSIVSLLLSLLLATAPSLAKLHLEANNGILHQQDGFGVWMVKRRLFLKLLISQNFTVEIAISFNILILGNKRRISHRDMVWKAKHRVHFFMHFQARIYQDHEPVMFFAIFQSSIIFKGGLSKGYKNYIAEKELPDDTYSEDGLALFRVQGSGPENMQSIQVEPVASSLNSSYCYILHSGSSIFTWSGNLTTPDDQELAERQLDIIKPNMQCRVHKEGSESDQFWDLLGEKTEYSSQKIARVAESDPHMFSCTLSKGDLKVTEVYNFSQDDLMTEDIFILDCCSDVYVWVGQQVESKNKMNALSLGEKPRRRIPVFGARSAPEKPQRSRSVSFSPDRVRVRGRSPAFNALASTFENPNTRNLSTPPPMVRKIFPKSVVPDSDNQASRSAAIAALSAASGESKPRSEGTSRENSVDHLKPKPETIQEDVKEDEPEDDEGLPIYPYERLTTVSDNPVEDIDVTKRETYLSSEEFKEKFGMAKSAFYKLPKWKQNKLKVTFNCSSPSKASNSLSFHRCR